VHDRTDEPLPPGIEVGLTAQDKFVEFDATVRATREENPFTGPTVTVELLAVPATPSTEVGLALIVKSWTTYETITEWERLPLVPVTVTCTVDVDEKVHESVEVPEPTTLLGVTEHEVLSVLRLTGPANPFMAVTARLEVPGDPRFTLMLVGLATTAKSWTLYVTVTEWDSEPLDPVTPTCIVAAAVKVHDKVALPDPVTLVGFAAHDVLLVAKPTIPAKPFDPETVTVVDPALPAFTLTMVGVRLIVKSWMVKVTVAEWDKPPLVPVVVTWVVEADAKEHDRVELPEPETLGGDTVHDVLLVAKPTSPAKPLSPETVTVEVTVDPALPVTLVGLTAIVKSWTR
jgi:hypothetical protein